MLCPTNLSSVQCPGCKEVTLTSVKCGQCGLMMSCGVHQESIVCPQCQSVNQIPAEARSSAAASALGQAGAAPANAPAANMPSTPANAPSKTAGPQTMLRCEACGTSLLAPAGSPVVMCPLCRAVSKIPQNQQQPQQPQPQMPPPVNLSAEGKRDLVQRFQDVTAASETVAQQQLEAAGWQLQSAVDMFLSGDMQPMRQQAAQRQQAPQPPAYTPPAQSATPANVAPVQKVSWSGMEPWLTSLDLTKYLESFVVNEVLDLDTLLELSEEDLKEMDVTVGARRKMLASMRTLSAAKTAGTLVTE